MHCYLTNHLLLLSVRTTGIVTLKRGLSSRAKGAVQLVLGLGSVGCREPEHVGV